MSLRIVEDEINRFLISVDPEVMVIRGEWGTGKTFTWKRLLNESNKDSLSTKRYSYVSLFGVNDLNDFRFLLFQQCIPNTAIGMQPSMQSFTKNAALFAESYGRKATRFLNRIPIISDFMGEIRSLAYLSLSETLICIDDLERKGKNLDVREILGTISQLKEEKSCKVVLILNQSGLNEENRSQLESYREKVVDIELTFSPTAEECIEISLDTESSYGAQLRPLLLKLGITNIRIIYRIRRLIKIVAPHLKDLEPELLQQAIHTLTLFTWCYLSDDSVSPSYKFITREYPHGFGAPRDEEDSENKDGWKSILQDYGFFHVDEFDLALAKVVETGHVDAKALREAATNLNCQIIVNKGDQSFKEAWDLYHDTFSDNQNEVIEMVFSRFMDNVSFITPLSLNATVSLLRDLKRDDLADNCISHYVESRKGEYRIFDLEEYAFAGDITDTLLKDAFAKALVASEPEITLHDVVERIAGKNGWGRKDIEVMSRASEDDFYQLFKSEQGDHLRSYVKACLQFKRISNASDTEKAISYAAEEALRRIGRESDINRRRVSSFGVKVEQE